MTAQLDKALTALKKEFAAEIASGLITSLGTYNCRHKNNDPDQPWSEHAWPNAVDVMLKRIPGTTTPTPEAKAVGYRVAKWMRAHPELWREVFWQVQAHFDHVHGTANPAMNLNGTNTPPCAGGGDDPMPAEAVEGIQRVLNTNGFAVPVLTVDGNWGPKTEAAFDKMAKAAKQAPPASTGVTPAQLTAAITAHEKKAGSATVHPHKHGTPTGTVPASKTGGPVT